MVAIASKCPKLKLKNMDNEAIKIWIRTIIKLRELNAKINKKWLQHIIERRVNKTETLMATQPHQHS